MPGAVSLATRQADPVTVLLLAVWSLTSMQELSAASREKALQTPGTTSVLLFRRCRLVTISHDAGLWKTATLETLCT